MRLAIAFGLTILLLGFALVLGEGEKKAKKKSILDFNEADVERIFQEWEVRACTCVCISLVPRLCLSKLSTVNHERAYEPTTSMCGILLY